MAAASAAEKTVSIATENKAGAVPGYLFESSEGKAKSVAIVVIQEWWGINSEIKLKGKKFADAGISAIVPDLYRGKTATSDQEASHLMDGLDWPGAVLDIKGAAAHLKSLGYSKVFVTGYCMGGALTIAAAVHDAANLTGAICYYGIPPKALADPANLKVPLQAHFGTKDGHKGFSDQPAAKALQDTLKQIKASHEFYHYEGLDHAFTKSDGKNYNKEGADLAFGRTIDFIAKHIVAEKVVSIQTENKAGAVPGYLYEADVKSKDKAIVVIQEWWGINNEIKGKGKAFASKGLTSIVPDLYRGKTATSDQEASHLMDGLDWPGAVSDIKGAAEHLKSLGYKKIFVTGYCMGGALALASSIRHGDVFAGGIPYYGIPPKGLADPANLKVPVQCHFGTLDAHKGFSDPEAAKALEDTLKQIKANYEFYTYEGANHAFTKTDGPNFSPVHAATAFKRTLDFIAKH